MQIQPGNKKYSQRGWWVLAAGDGVGRAACTAPGFGSVEGRRVLLLNREGCVPMAFVCLLLRF